MDLLREKDKITSKNKYLTQTIEKKEKYLMELKEGFDNTLKFNERLNKDIKKIKDTRPKTAFVKSHTEDKT